VWGEGAEEGLLFRPSSLGRVSVGEECGCSRGHARENGACPKLQARSAREQEGYFVLALRCVLVQIFHRIFPQSLFSGTSGLGRAS